MTFPDLSQIREGAFWKKRLPSFFVFGTGVLLFLSSCKTFHSPPENTIDFGVKRGEMQIARIQKERKIVFAVIRGAREEKLALSLAEKAASLLKVDLEVRFVQGEEIPSLLRSSRADFAWGSFSSPREVKELYLLPLEIREKEENHIFALPRNGESWKELLRNALQAAITQKGQYE